MRRAEAIVTSGPVQMLLSDTSPFFTDKTLHIMSRPADADGAQATPLWSVLEQEEVNRTPEPSKFTPLDDGGSNNIIAYVSVLAAVVLGLIVYVAYKW